MLFELRMRNPHALAQFPDCPAHDVTKFGSFSDATTLNGVGAEGVG